MKVDDEVCSALTGRRGRVVAVAGDLVTVLWHNDDEFTYTFKRRDLVLFGQPLLEVVAGRAE